VHSQRHLPALVASLALAVAVAAPAQARPAPGVTHHRRVAVARNVHHAVLTEGVSAPGLYDVAVTVAARARRTGVVRLLIGPVLRRTRAGGPHRRSRITLRLRIRGRTLTVRASSRRLMLRLRVRFTPIGPPNGGAKRSSPTTKAVAVAPTANSSAATGATGATGTTAAVSTPAPAPAAPAAPTGPFALPPGFAPVTDYTNLVEDYEFTGSALPSDWSAGSGNDGFSATSFEPSQVSLTGSSVGLTAINAPIGSYPYQSGYISTIGRYTLRYGMVDFRARMPAGQGLWSGLWMRSASANPGEEIDVQEMLLADTHTVYGSAHDWGAGWQQVWHETQSSAMAADASAGFNDYEVIWQPGMLTWAVDGVAYAQYTAAEAAAAGYPWPFDSPGGVSLIADLAVGGASDWGGAPNASTAFPAVMQIQSVRVWQ